MMRARIRAISRVPNEWGLLRSVVASSLPQSMKLTDYADQAASVAGCVPRQTVCGRWIGVWLIAEQMGQLLEGISALVA